MQSIRQVQRLNDVELERCVPPNASWHTDYRDTAYIYVGGLPYELSEGDVLAVFSQYGNPVHINLVRDKDTGKSRGFCFLKYEDQRSCDLAVDNLSGASVMGRLMSVDHTRYKKKEGEVEGVGDEVEENETDHEGAARSKRQRTGSEESEEERPRLKEEVELAKLLREHDDDDPMKAYLVKEKKVEVEEALKAVAKRKARDRVRSHKYRHHRSTREDIESVGDDDRQRKMNGHRSRREREDDAVNDDTGRRRSLRSRRETLDIPDAEYDSRPRHRHYRQDEGEDDHSRRRARRDDSERSRSRDRNGRR